MIYDYDNYYRAYYNNNKDKYIRSNKKYLEKNKRHCIYKLIDCQDYVRYVGSTENIYSRISQHSSGNTHLELTYERWQALGCHFEYAYVDAITMEERLYIEHYLINKYAKRDKKIWNCRECYVERNFSLTEERKCELEEIAEHLDFKVFDR